MSAWSEYRHGYITEEEYNDYCRWEDQRERALIEAEHEWEEEEEEEEDEEEEPESLIALASGFGWAIRQWTVEHFGKGTRNELAKSDRYVVL